MASLLGNIDRETALLIAELSLNDINELRRPDDSGDALSDEDYALQLMAEEFSQVLAAADDDGGIGDFEEEPPTPSGDNGIWPPNLDIEEPPPIKTCAVCMENHNEELFSLCSCQHHYCGSCLEQYIETCIHNENTFPPKCCDQPITFADADPRSLGSPAENLARSLDEHYLGIDSNLGARLRAKASEFDVPPQDRVYCPNPRCSSFLGSSSSLQDPHTPKLGQSEPFQCPTCSELVCTLCRKRAHPDQSECQSMSVEDELAELELHELARSKRWQTCPGCKAIVEITHGCNHMICRCRAEFCYLCGSEWRGVCICQGGGED
ncbi:hypothetical protein GYMLUDRAFT_88380 [Collybiopsis luxurians FD-317 M1]|uniref:RBR-type E3 ubiquitin transferase n=1 Tax=Collybiopsis luxurians FD-317 M1 TaxID=944289 RepID=A0A0D0C6H4_9AGAR|nr:hypothetical protein GYMLUDRAFT_88380 [Collybiopsis luxurians FD-317 M1]